MLLVPASLGFSAGCFFAGLCFSAPLSSEKSCREWYAGRSLSEFRRVHACRYLLVVVRGESTAGWVGATDIGIVPVLPDVWHWQSVPVWQKYREWDWCGRVFSLAIPVRYFVPVSTTSRHRRWPCLFRFLRCMLLFRTVFPTRRKCGSWGCWAVEGISSRATLRPFLPRKPVRRDIRLLSLRFGCWWSIPLKRCVRFLLGLK